MRSLSNPRQIAISLAFLLILLGFFYTATQQQKNKTIRLKTQTQTTGIQTPADFQTSTRPPTIDDPFYRTIIDNNLFRPLGWQPPPKKQTYRLLGTLIPSDSQNAPQAIIQVNASKHIRILRIGCWRLNIKNLVSSL